MIHDPKKQRKYATTVFNETDSEQDRGIFTDNHHKNRDRTTYQYQSL